MARRRLDADEDRRVACVALLQARRELERVAGHDAVVGVGGRHHRRRILRAGGQPVIRRVRVERLEFLGIVGRTVVVGPVAARREALEAQHVHHADRRQRGAEQLGALRHHGADKEASVRTALDRESARARPLLGDEVLGGCDEVVEDILLAQLLAGLVPLAAVLAAAAEIRNRERAAELEPRREDRREPRRHRSVEAAVAVEERRLRAVARRALAVRDEHRNARAVLRGVEDLLDLVAGRVEVDLGAAELGGLSGREVESVDRRRLVVRGEAVEGLAVAATPAETTGCSDARQLDLAHERAVGAQHADERPHILQVLGEDEVADHARALEHLRLLGHELAQRLQALADIERDDAAARRLEVGGRVEGRAVVSDDRPLVRKRADDLARLRGWIAEIADEEQVLRIGAFVDRDDEVASVLRDACAEAPGRVLGPREDERVLPLRRAEAVVADLVVEVERLELLARLRLGEAAVEEALLVLRPRCAGELRPADLVGQDRARRDIHHAPAGPVGSGLALREGKQVARIGERHASERDGAVLRPSVRVEQDARLAVERILDVDDRLVLEAVVLGEDIARALLRRRGVARIVEQLLEPRADRAALGDRREERVGDLVLRRDPRGDLGVDADIVLEPAVRVGDLRAVVVVGLIDLSRLRVVERDALGRSVAVARRWRCAAGREHCGHRGE